MAPVQPANVVTSQKKSLRAQLYGSVAKLLDEGDHPALKLLEPSGSSATNQPKQQSTGLFGSTATSQPQQQSSSPFGASTTTSQPAQSGSLFGSTTTNSQAQPGAGLFGSNTATSQPQQGGSQQSGGLFGSNNATSEPKQYGGLFGSNSTTSQPQQGGSQQSGGLFGSGGGGGGSAFGQQQQSQPQQTSTGPFGSLGQSQQQSQPQQASTGLFGSLGQPQQQSQPQQTSTGLFGSLGQSQPQSQPQQSTSLFGGSTFGQSQPQSQPQQTTSSFGNSLWGQSQSQPQHQQSQMQQQPQPNISGNLGIQGRAATASLFGSSTAGRPSTSLFPGPLTMGQSTNNNTTTAQPSFGQSQQAPSTVSGVAIDLSQIRGTTRFNDLHSDLQAAIERIDTFIAQQISYAEQCAQLLPAHADSIAYLPNDVQFVQARLDGVEAALDADARAVANLKTAADGTNEHAKRAFRALENLRLPAQFHYSGAWPAHYAHHHHHQGRLPRGAPVDAAEEAAASTDLLGYFEGVVGDMEGLLKTYGGNMREVEEHLKTVEQSAIRQTEELIARKGRERARGEKEGSDEKDENLRELVTVLREFEHGILNVAGNVGACREQVQELMLGGRLNGFMR
ncbi:MAG: hypothetical protein M1822_008979 [Bathelium mastoideum]|nr:MAG: hypothetical protein M1822_008979 [Bathelium mastoideum]